MARAAVAPPGIHRWEVQEGACLEIPRQRFEPLFFAAPGDKKSVAEAKAICAGCSVRRPCLEEVLAGPDGPGVRGGLTETERRAVRKARKRAEQSEEMVVSQ